MKATEIFRNAVISATLDEVTKSLEAHRSQLLKGRGSWKIRSMGVTDAIELIERMKKVLLSETE